MAALSAIRAGIKDRLATISGLAAHDFVRGNLVTPAALVGFPSRIEYDASMGRGVDRYTIPIKIVVALTDEDATNDALEEYLAKTGTKSIKATIENARPQTLGGIVADCRVTAMTGAGGQILGGVEYLVADFELDVYA